jgi:hypothetical protein
MMELEERDCQIIGARYGLVHDEMTLQECGDRLGITKERVRQIQSRGEDKLRTLLKCNYPGLFDSEEDKGDAGESDANRPEIAPSYGPGD